MNTGSACEGKGREDYKLRNLILAALPKILLTCTRWRTRTLVFSIHRTVFR